MDVYVARQPVFDRKMNLYGYELLYRRSENNYFEGVDDREATATVLANSVLVVHFNELIDGTRGLINFPADFLVQGLPRLLPRQKIVVEVLERVQATKAVIAACRRLKKDGYIIALDDFVLNYRKQYQELVELADIIKIEFPKVKLTDQLRFIRRYEDKITFLAEKIETEKQFHLAMKMGYQLFQGYFFSRPAMINATDIGALDVNLIRIIKELKQNEPNMGLVARLIEQDLGLSYKVLRLANTVHFGTQFPVKSIRQALVRIGTQHLVQWMHLFLLNNVRNNENRELIKVSMIRGRMMALLCRETGRQEQESVYFITGIFSALDRILNDSMQHITDGLPLDREVKDALHGAQNPIRRTLDSIIDFEEARWDTLGKFIVDNQLSARKYMSIYLQALKWQKAIPRDPISGTLGL